MKKKGFDITLNKMMGTGGVLFVAGFFLDFRLLALGATLAGLGYVMKRLGTPNRLFTIPL